MPAPAAANEQIGHYELLEQIGRGGMGVVFRARDPRLQRLVALKLILAGRLASDHEVKRFRTEAEAAAQLEHPHIVPIYEVGESMGRHFFVMKFMEGGSLGEKLSGPQSPAFRESTAAARLVARIARAVHHAHQRGILHRDLKPANILLDAGGEPGISDFGLAKRFTESEAGPQDSDHTLSGAILGSPSYMSPEQADGRSHEVTTAADIYSLGAILYHLLTGRPPFEGGTALEIIRKVLDEDPVRPRKVERNGTTRHAPAVDGDLETICLKCLAKEPTRRYASAAALAEDLERWERGEPILARPVGAIERLWKWARRRPAGAALVIGTVVAAVAFISLLGISQAMLRRERDHARQQERLASASELRARTEAQHAESNALTARLSLYAADIYTAAQFVEAGQMGPALALLRQHEPAPGQKDLRSFEWRLLRARCEGDDARVLRAEADSRSGAFYTLAFSPDGRQMIAGSDREIHRWDATTWEHLSQFPDPKRRAVWSAKGEQGIELMKRDPSKAFELLTGGTSLEKEISPSRPDVAHATAMLGFSPDAQTIVTAGRTEFVKFWDAQTGLMRSFCPTENASVAILPDGRAVISESAGTGRPAEIVDPATGAVLQNLIQGCTALAISPNHQWLVTVQERRNVTVWNASNLVEVARFRTSEALQGRVHISSDGRHVASAVQSGREAARCYDASHADRPALMDRLDSRIISMAFSPDGTQLALGLRDSTVRLHDTATGAELRRLSGHRAEVFAVAWSPDGHQLASTGDDRTIRLWNLGHTQQVNRLTRKFHHPLIFPGGDQIAGVTDGKRIAIWNGVDADIRPLNDHTGFIPLAFPPGKSTLLVGHALPDYRVELEWWSLADGTTLRATNLEGGPMMAASLDGDRVALWRKEEILIYDLASGKQSARIIDARLQFNSDSAILDGPRFALKTFPGGAAVWDVVSGRRLTPSPMLHNSRVGGLALTADGGTLITGDADNSIHLWETRTGQRLRLLAGHGGTVHALAISPDGRTLASSAEDRLTKLWSLATGRELMTLHRGTEISRLSFSRDGRMLIGTPSSARGLLVWTAPEPK